MKANRLVKLRQNLMKARECYLYAQVGSSDGFETAQKVSSVADRHDLINEFIRFSEELEPTFC